MEIVDIIYTILVGPLELLLEIAYTIIYQFIENHALTIVALSLIIHFFALPWYRKADAIQKATSNGRQEVEKDDINGKIMGGYDRYISSKILNVLKSSLLLLLELIFFIATYTMSNEK